jgi:CHAT domain-containing protein
MKSRAFGKNHVLGFAPSFPVDSSENYPLQGSKGPFLSPLPYSKLEVQTIHNEFGGIAFFDSVATKHTFIKESPAYGILHVSTHGLADDVRPLESMLVFHQKQIVSDSNLHLYELFNLKLNAYLVVLSACNTGYGAINDGEGIMSLSSGFSYAGVSAIVASLWQVNDQSTSQIMKDFYKHLFNKEIKPAALQMAQVDYLSVGDPILSHPYFWASFFIVGNTNPLPSFNYGLFFICLFIIIGLVTTLIIVFKNRRKS